MISTDRKIFEEGSAVRARMIEYGKLFDELHIIVFSKRFTLHASRFTLSDNTFVYPTNSISKLFYISNAIRIGKSILLKSTTDWVVSCQDPFETGFAGWKIAKSTGAKLHLQIHTDFLNPYFKTLSLLNRIRVRLALFLLPKANGIRVVSERIKNSLEAANLKLGASVAVLPIFVDKEQVEANYRGVDLKRKYPQFNFIILVVSRLTREKNVEGAIGALAYIHKKYPKVGLVIVGSGPLESSLKLKARSYHLEASVIFEGWQNDTASYYKSADAFLFPSRYEGYGLALIEAALLGCPVVTTNVGIAGDVCKNGENAFVCKVNDAQCLALGIMRLVENVSLRHTFSLRLKEAVEATLPKNKEEYLGLYKKSLGI